MRARQGKDVWGWGWVCLYVCLSVPREALPNSSSMFRKNPVVKVID